MPYKLPCLLLQPITNNAATYKAWQIFQAAWRKATYFLGSLMVHSSWLLPILLIVVTAATAAAAAAGLVLIVIVIIFVVVVAAAAVVIVAVILIRPGKSL